MGFLRKVGKWYDFESAKARHFWGYGGTSEKKSISVPPPPNYPRSGRLHGKKFIFNDYPIQE